MSDTRSGRKCLIHSAAFGVFFTLAVTVVSFETGSDSLFCTLLWPACIISDTLDPHPNIHNPSFVLPLALIITAAVYTILAYIVLRLIKR